MTESKQNNEKTQREKLRNMMKLFHHQTGLITPAMIGRIDVPLIAAIEDMYDYEEGLSIPARRPMWASREPAGLGMIRSDEIMQNIIRATGSKVLSGGYPIRPEDVKSWNQNGRLAYLDAVAEVEYKAAHQPPNVTAEQPISCLRASIITEQNWKLIPATELPIWAAGWGVRMRSDPYQTVLDIISLQNGLFREVMAAGHGRMSDSKSDSFLSLIDAAADPDYEATEKKA